MNWSLRVILSLPVAFGMVKNAVYFTFEQEEDNECTLDSLGNVIGDLVHSFRIRLDRKSLMNFSATNSENWEYWDHINRSRISNSDIQLDDAVRDGHFDFDKENQHLLHLSFLKPERPAIIKMLPHFMSKSLESLRCFGRLLAETTESNQIRTQYLEVIYEFVGSFRVICISGTLCSLAQEPSEDLGDIVNRISALLDHEFPFTQRPALCILFNSQSRDLARGLDREEMYNQIQRTVFGYDLPDDPEADQIFSHKSMARIWHQTGSWYKLESLISEVMSPNFLHIGPD